MSSREQHEEEGIARGILWYLANLGPGERPNFGELVVTMLGASVAATLPDRLEPPYGPGHRGFFHSRFLASLILSWVRGYINNPSIPASNKRIVGGWASAYLSHLDLDARTKRGLPLLTRRI